MSRVKRRRPTEEWPRQTTQKGGVEDELGRNTKVDSRLFFRQDVPDTANGFDEFRRSGIVTEFLAQMRDMHVDRPFADGDITSAGFGQQGITRDDAPGAFGQSAQQIEFEAREIHGFACFRHDTLPEVHDDIAGNESFSDDVGTRSPQYGFDSRDEFPGAERFGDIIVGAHFEAHDAIGFVTARGQHEDGDIAFLTNSATNLDAIHAGHHQIQQYDIEGSGFERGESSRTVGSRGYVKIVLPEISREQIEKANVVVDEHNTQGHLRTLQANGCVDKLGVRI